MNSVSAGHSQTLLRTILENAKSLTEGQLLAAGLAARRLLAFAWFQPERSPWLVTNALRSVCQTFDTEPVESVTLLRQAIEPAHLASYGYEEMHWVTRELKRISLNDPAFVADIYVAIFNYDEMSDDTTDMSQSQILALTSNRKQDYDQAKWQLSEYYPQFARYTPVLAAKAMISVIEAYCKREHASRTPPESFSIDGIETVLAHDYSCIWDEGFASHHDNEVKILDAFFQELEELIQKPQSGATVDAVLAVLKSGPRQAVIWRRLLQLGARHPSNFGMKIRALGWVAPILWVPDTEGPAGDFIAALFPLLGGDERRKSEDTIISLPHLVPESMRDVAERQRDQLLSRLADGDLVTEAAKKLLRELRETSAIPTPAARGPRVQITTRTVDEEMYLREILGVAAENEVTKNFMELYRPVKEFTGKQMNKIPSEEEINAALASFQALHRALLTPFVGIEEELLTMGYGSLAEACKIITKAPDLSCESPAGIFARSVLIELSEHPSPEHNPEQDESFDRHPSWGAPLARIEAAAGLMSLARHKSCCSPDVLDRIDFLSKDAAPEVRYQIAAYLTSLYETAPDRMWKLLETRSKEETSNGVLGALALSINNLRGVDHDRTAQLSRRIFERAKGEGADKTREICLSTFVGLYVWYDHPISKAVLYGLTLDVLAFHAEIAKVLFLLRPTLTYVEESQQAHPLGARSRSVELFHILTAAACDSFETVWEQQEQKNAPETDPDVLKSLARLVAAAASQIFFASGAFREHRPHEEQVSATQQQQFYVDLAATIDRLSMIGFASVVHHLVETLEVFISFEPRRVFLQVAKLVESGRRGRYQYESMGAEKIVGIVQRYIAEHRSLLQEDAECRVALRSTLDIFVEAGWPAAQRLSYRLDDIFR